jgi:hypothetical protein
MNNFIIFPYLIILQFHRDPIIDPDIQVELLRLILVVVICIIKECPDEVVTVFALRRFQGVTALYSLWKASQGL